MSRVDEERELAREAERLLQRKVDAEQRAASQRSNDRAFEKLVSQGQQREQAQGRERRGRRVLAEVVSDRDFRSREAQQQLLAGQRARAENARADGGALERGLRAKEEIFTSRDESATEHLGAAERHGASSADRERREERISGGRQADARSSQEHDEERQAKSSARTAGAAGRGEREVDSESGSGSKQGGGGQDDQRGSGEGGMQSFRLNPALLSPPPLAQPRTSSTSERLRALANEIAQKIVARVHVGGNGAGRAEFHIEMKSNVLAGLAIRIASAKDGIHVVFQSREREVVKLLRGQADQLKELLKGRVRLAEIKVEERA